MLYEMEERAADEKMQKLLDKKAIMECQSTFPDDLACFFFIMRKIGATACNVLC